MFEYLQANPLKSWKKAQSVRFAYYYHYNRGHGDLLGSPMAFNFGFFFVIDS